MKEDITLDLDEKKRAKLAEAIATWNEDNLNELVHRNALQKTYSRTIQY